MPALRHGQEVRVNSKIYVIRTVKYIEIKTKLTMIVDMEEKEDE